MQYTLAHHSGDLEEAPETVDAAVSWCPGMTAAPPAAPRPHPWHGSHPRGDTPEVLACNALVSPNSAGVCLDAVTVVMPVLRGHARGRQPKVSGSRSVALAHARDLRRNIQNASLVQNQQIRPYGYGGHGKIQTLCIMCSQAFENDRKPETDSEVSSLVVIACRQCDPRPRIYWKR